jgi:transposase
MSNELKDKTVEQIEVKEEESPRLTLPPLPNYTLSSVCPACGAPTVRRACKVRCERCGFVWDCGEL